MPIESHGLSAGGLDWAGFAQARGDLAWLAALRAEWAAADTAWGHHGETPAAHPAAAPFVGMARDGGDRRPG